MGADIAQITTDALRGGSQGYPDDDRLSFGLEAHSGETATVENASAIQADREAGPVSREPSPGEARMNWLPTTILSAILLLLAFGWSVRRARKASGGSREAHVRRLRRLLAEGAAHEE